MTRQSAPPTLDLWVKLLLKEQFGSVAREPIPDDWLRLLDALPPEH